LWQEKTYKAKTSKEKLARLQNEENEVSILDGTRVKLKQNQAAWDHEPKMTVI
jgi:hypothetical protein